MINTKLAAIRDKVESRGWEVVEVRDISYLWVAEIWKLRSAWSPSELVLYFLFSVDPHCDSTEFDKVRWLHASPAPPIDWSRDKGESESNQEIPALMNNSTVVGKGQDKYLAEFLDALDQWRDAVAKSNSN